MPVVSKPVLLRFSSRPLIKERLILSRIAKRKQEETIFRNGWKSHRVKWRNINRYGALAQQNLITKRRLILNYFLPFVTQFPRTAPNNFMDRFTVYRWKKLNRWKAAYTDLLIDHPEFAVHRGRGLIGVPIGRGDLVVVARFYDLDMSDVA